MFTSSQKRYSFFTHSALPLFFLAVLLITIAIIFFLFSAVNIHANNDTALSEESKLEILNTLSGESARPSTDERQAILEAMSRNFSSQDENSDEENDSAFEQTVEEGLSLFGFAWSDNFGWVSFNCEDTNSCSSADYSVIADEVSGELGGFAWSDNLGWISFNESSLTQCPQGECKAILNEESLKGWARVCSVFESGCSGAIATDDYRGGWDGWISLSGEGYGVILNGSNFEGFAWDGSDVSGQTIGTGWIEFNPLFGGVSIGTPIAPQCSDGIDNDVDGLIDFSGGDPGCDSQDDDNESNDIVDDGDGGAGGGGGGGGGVPPASVASSGGGGGGGGTTIRLEISNEKVEQIATSTVLITWNTNLQATGQVFFDTSSHATSSMPFDQYASSTAKTSVFVTEHSVIIFSLEQGVTYYFRPAAFRSDREVGGKELSITLGEKFEAKEAPAVSAVCEKYLLEFIKFGGNNNPLEVVKLQTFLKNFENFTDVPVNGVYDEATFKAVSAFQERYSDEILATWGIESPTGYVYITTTKKINELYCQREFALTDEQKREIEEYRALLKQMRDEGATPERIEEILPEVGVIDLKPQLVIGDISTTTIGAQARGVIRESILASTLSSALMFVGSESFSMILLLIVVAILGFALYELMIRSREKRPDN